MSDPDPRDELVEALRELLGPSCLVATNRQEDFDAEAELRLVGVANAVSHLVETVAFVALDEALAMVPMKVHVKAAEDLARALRQTLARYGLQTESDQGDLPPELPPTRRGRLALLAAYETLGALLSGDLVVGRTPDGAMIATVLVAMQCALMEGGLLAQEDVGNDNDSSVVAELFSTMAQSVDQDDADSFSRYQAGLYDPLLEALTAPGSFADRVRQRVILGDSGVLHVLED